MTAAELSNEISYLQTILAASGSCVLWVNGSLGGQSGRPIWQNRELLRLDSKVGSLCAALPNRSNDDS